MKIIKEENIDKKIIMDILFKNFREENKIDRVKKDFLKTFAHKKLILKKKSKSL